MNNEPIFSNLSGKGSGFFADGTWGSFTGTYCPAGTYDGVTSYSNGNGYMIYRKSGAYWYVQLTNDPSGSGLGPPKGTNSNASTPPLTGWSNGLTLVSVSC